jgi:hypothetical protein
VSVENTPQDTTAPAVSITSPATGSSVTGTVQVSGSATDVVGVTAVQVSVDGGAWVAANGTSSWSWTWSTAGLAAGSHTVTARALDAAGNVGSASVTVSTGGGASAPQTQGTWVTPEGATIDVRSAGPWTIAAIYRMLLENAGPAGDFAQIAPTLTVKVQDSFASQTASSAVLMDGQYSSYRSTLYLKGVSSSFAEYPNDVLGHEYGHVWTKYYLYLRNNNDWGSYLRFRGIAGDARLDSTSGWSPSEMAAEDYRLLLGSQAAVAERPWPYNQDIAHPRDVAGLRDFFLATWRGR